MTKKQILRCVAFALILSALMIVLCDLFEQENNKNFDMRYQTFKHMPKDTVDAVYIGTSGVDRYWIAPKAYEEYGMTVYPLSIDELPSYLYIDLLKDAIDRQSPELLIIDMRGFQQGYTVEELDVRSRRVLDAMDFFSVARVKAAVKTMKLIHELDQTKPLFDLSLLLSFIKYHSKWSEETYQIQNNLGDRLHSYGGFYMNATDSVKAIEVNPQKVREDTMAELDPISEKALYELLDFLAQQDVEVLFVYSPRVDGIRKVSSTNRIKSILDEKGFEYVVYQFGDPADDNYIEFDLKADYYDQGHVNYYGAEKYTAHFAAYLNEKYSLPDRRNDSNVNRYWEGLYEKIINQIAEYEQ